MPAMNELIPNAASLTLRTLIPAAAAARSFERTASIRCPNVERRRFATYRPSRTTQPTTKKPNTGLGTLSSIPRKGPYGPRSIPSLGSGTGELDVPPPHVALRKTNCSIAYAAASVITARATPRTRRAENPIRTPSTVAPSAPISITHGKPTPWSVARWERMKPEMPARASWTTEI